MSIRNVVIGLLAVCVAASAGADFLNARCTMPTQFTMPAASPASEVFIKAGSGEWTPAEYETIDSKLRFHLDPGALGSSDIMLLINPPADLDIDDSTPPSVIGVKVDGKALRAMEDIHLGLSDEAPRMLKFGIADGENALDETSVKATINDRPLDDHAVTVTPITSQKATVTVHLGQVDYGKYEVAVSVADASPQRNTATARVTFDHFDTTNVLLADAGEVELKVDSCFANYESLAPLNDGAKDLTGVHCRNDVSWASAETPSPHWIEVTLDEPRTIEEVSVWWAYYNNTYHTSQDIEIQVPDGDGWKIVYQSPEGGHEPSAVTTFRFEPLETDRFRIYQHAGGGCAGRPDLMWVAEIEAR
ncbi:MAG: discoidin domain-containing protein [Armatimonadota bacterium]